MPLTPFNHKELAEDAPIPRLEFKMFGDWDKAIKTFQNLSPAIKKASMKAQTKVCTEIYKRVRQHLIGQDLNWKQLSEKYLKAKTEKGLDPDILYAYGNYFNSIKVWEKKGSGFVYVGVPKGSYTMNLNGKRSKIDIATIAYINEMGGGKVPARPLWNPTLAEIGGIQGIKSMYTRSLVYWLKRENIEVNKTPFGND